MNSVSKEKDLGTMIIETIVMLLEDQTGKKFDYYEETNKEDKTA